MIFRQLIDPESSTYTYLLGCPETREAVLLDPVCEMRDRDLAVIQNMGLTLKYTLETHVHADHITAACRLRSVTGCKVAYPAMDELPCADIGVSELEPLTLGSMSLKPLFTPGHTDTHHCYLLDKGGTTRVFTGDALLIDGCGRTDFQSGDAATLYRSVHDKLFTLPDETLVYPAHDYQHRHVSSIIQEKERNARLGNNRELEEFIEIMNNLDLPYPKKIDVAVPANMRCGDCSDADLASLPDGLSIQG
ncbi:MAG: MBL fold metallo-hydrolase [Erythrobacteraceae bacterium]|jgi:glyoxylase-like metal-dependent hydrolase (beta-lactamase superfamily II)|nr:MBL fold metallo-hydrolase [Erythrobacteraceae bacterium]